MSAVAADPRLTADHEHTVVARAIHGRVAVDRDDGAVDVLARPHDDVADRDASVLVADVVDALRRRWSGDDPQRDEGEQTEGEATGDDGMNVSGSHRAAA